MKKRIHHCVVATTNVTALRRFERRAAPMNYLEDLLKKTIAIRADSEDGVASFKVLYRDFNANFQPADGDRVGFLVRDYEEAAQSPVPTMVMQDSEPNFLSDPEHVINDASHEELVDDREEQAFPDPADLPPPPPEPPHSPSLLSRLSSTDSRGDVDPSLIPGLIKRARTLIRRKGKMLHELQEKRANVTHSGLIRITDFEFLKPLSRGGFSHVYLARKIETGALFAMKVMEKATLKAMDMAERVKQERQIMALLGKQCPYVVKLHFAFRSQHHLFFAMDYVPGGDCAGMLKTYGTIHEGRWGIISMRVPMVLPLIIIIIICTLWWWGWVGG